jgi:large subunit ribosomal protein L21e
MINRKGKRMTTHCMFSRPFSKRGVVPLTTYIRIYKRSEIVDIKRIGIVQCRRVYNVTHHAMGMIINKQVKGKILVQCVD